MIRAIALDDERPALEIMDAFCSQLDTVDLQQTFTRTADARRYLQEHPVDLLLTDINMPAESGIAFYKSISPLVQDRQLMVIFTTAYSEYAVESYELQAVDYLLKPFTLSRFRQAIQKAADQQALRLKAEAPATLAPTYLTFRVDYGLAKIDTADILFVEGLDNYLKIHLVNQKPLVVRLTMKAMAEKLPASAFVRVHRSFIVPLNRIEFVRNKLITIGDEEIPLGSSYERDFFTLFRE